MTLPRQTPPHFARRKRHNCHAMPGEYHVFSNPGGRAHEAEGFRCAAGGRSGHRYLARSCRCDGLPLSRSPDHGRRTGGQCHARRLANAGQRQHRHEGDHRRRTRAEGNRYRLHPRSLHRYCGGNCPQRCGGDLRPDRTRRRGGQPRGARWGQSRDGRSNHGDAARTCLPHGRGGPFHARRAFQARTDIGADGSRLPGQDRRADRPRQGRALHGAAHPRLRHAHCIHQAHPPRPGGGKRSWYRMGGEPR